MQNSYELNWIRVFPGTPDVPEIDSTRGDLHHVANLPYKMLYKNVAGARTNGNLHVLLHLSFEVSVLTFSAFCENVPRDFLSENRRYSFS